LVLVLLTLILSYGAVPISSARQLSAAPALVSKLLTAAPPSHLVTRIGLDPPSPNILGFNQNVTISFTYTTTQTGGVRIFARPFAHGALAPNYAASGSPLYPVGSGTGSGTFTITAGDITVDQIRFQIWNAGQTQLLFEGFIPVYYRFQAAPTLMSKIGLDPPSPNILGFNQDVTISFTYTTTQTGGVRIFARPFAHGALAPNYAASGSPLYPIGSGTGSGTFTITAGDVTVDQIRFQILNADQTQLLFEGFIPVYYQFGRGQNYRVRLPLVLK